MNGITPLKSMQNHVFALNNSKTMRTWQIRSDQGRGVAIFTHDNEDPANVFAVNKMKSDAACMQNKTEEKNLRKFRTHYSFCIEPWLKDPKFIYQTEQLMGKQMLGYLNMHARHNECREFFLYPETPEQGIHTEWLQETFEKHKKVEDIFINSAEITLSEKKKVNGIAFVFTNDRSEMTAKKRADILKSLEIGLSAPE